MNPFEQNYEFIDNDNRQYRKRFPINAESSFIRHNIAVPEQLIKDKSILDLGCCIGGSGNWCLSKGAKSYTGVEFQSNYFEKAKTFLSIFKNVELHNLTVEDFLHENQRQHDIVLAMGILHCFPTNYYQIIKQICEAANEYVIVDVLSHDIEGNTIQLNEKTQLNSDKDTNDYLIYMFTGVFYSKNNLDIIFKSFGFEHEEIEKPNILAYNGPNAYRFIRKYKRSNNIKLLGLEYQNMPEEMTQEEAAK